MLPKVCFYPLKSKKALKTYHFSRLFLPAAFFTANHARIAQMWTRTPLRSLSAWTPFLSCKGYSPCCHTNTATSFRTFYYPRGQACSAHRIYTILPACRSRRFGRYCPFYRTCTLRSPRLRGYPLSSSRSIQRGFARPLFRVRLPRAGVLPHRPRAEGVTAHRRHVRRDGAQRRRARSEDQLLTAPLRAESVFRRSAIQIGRRHPETTGKRNKPFEPGAGDAVFPLKNGLPRYPDTRTTPIA